MKIGERASAVALIGALLCAPVCVVGCASSGTGQDDVDRSPEAFAQWRSGQLRKAQGLAERAEKTDDLVKKEMLLREAVETFPQHSAFWTNLGTVLAQQNDYASAAEAFSLAADLDPTDPRPPYNHGALYVNRFWYQPAVEHFERALERDPNYLNAVRGLARTRVVLRDFDEDLLSLLDRAVLLESDERWLSYFQRQRVVVRSELERGSGRSDDSDS